MGDVKAPDLAQCVHSHIAEQKGVLTHATWMSHGHPAPRGHTWCGCYIDDYAQVTVSDPRLGHPFTVSDTLASSASTHDCMLQAYRGACIERKVAKATKDEPVGSVWGACIDGPRKRVSTCPEKRKVLILATLECCRLGHVPPRLVQILCGHWQHHLAFHRPLMCVLDVTYAWIRRAYVDGQLTKQQRPLSRAVRDELLLLYATIKKGAVVVGDLCCPSQAGFLWRAADQPSYTMQFVPSYMCPSGEDPLQQPLFTMRFPFRENKAVTSFVETTQFKQ
eukprot:6476890-Amphidinium_carterae.1